MRSVRLMIKVAELVTKGVAEGQDMNLDPTDAQKEAGNYKKATINLDGLEIRIENPKDSTRTGVSADGEEWSQKMWDDYGYVVRTDGSDSDPVDVFINPGLPADTDTLMYAEDVYVVNQVNPQTKAFDEHKCMIGYLTKTEAKAAYMQNYEKGWSGCGTLVEMSWDRWKQWVLSNEPKKGKCTEAMAKEAKLDVRESSQATPFRCPENFDVHKKYFGDKLTLSTGGNDWECSFTCFALKGNPNYRGISERIWLEMNPPDKCDDFGYLTDGEKKRGVTEKSKQAAAEQQGKEFIKLWEDAARKVNAERVDKNELPDRINRWADALRETTSLHKYVDRCGTDRTEWKPTKLLKIARLLKIAKIILDIEIGDEILVGRFKNKPVVVETTGTDENGQPTINGRKLLSLRIAKLMPKKKKRASTSAAAKRLKKKADDKAPDGKAWGIRWADGRAIAHFKHKKHAQLFYDSGVGHDWFEPVDKKPVLRDATKGIASRAVKYKCSGCSKCGIKKKASVLDKAIRRAEGLPKQAYDKSKEWIGVDLDATLAKFTEWKGPSVIGKPIPRMVTRVKKWLAAGKTVKILTARASGDDGTSRRAIDKWTKEHIGQVLPVTCIKDMYCTAIYDDKAKGVTKNKGLVKTRTARKQITKQASILDRAINRAEGKRNC